jgi:secreted trypsin-like serine protease
MPPEIDDDANTRLVLDAIRKAEQAAPASDRDFVRALRASYFESQQRATGRLRMATAAPPAPSGSPMGPRSFHIHEDPRFARNARALAQRTVARVRIIGGTEVQPGEFDDCVAVGSDAEWGCSGTLVARNVVVTAGHCADFATRVFFGTDVRAAGRVVRVRKRHRHPRYHKGKHNDLMVLLLAENVTGVAPRRLAPARTINAATDGRVVGFGHTDPTGTSGYGRKRKVDVPVASPSCSGAIDGHDDSVSYGCDRLLELVAGRPLLARDTCSGDSGGPFYVDDGNGAWLLAAATSRATDSAVNNCGDGGIYVRLDKYAKWIAGIPGVTLPGEG